ncbi:putative FAD-binding domain-containing protein [Seiridium cardinale]
MSRRYQEFVGSYWSQQQIDVHPHCIFIPFAPQDVAVQVLTCQLFACHFSVKSGGHASFAGASSVQSGITVSLERLDEITVSEDRKLVAIGMGNRWGDVYEKLEEYDLTVIGGRDADVGVGGYTLGGGMSFFSNLYGWACDNVAQYEIALANGTILQASQNSHAGLYRALRGGSDNFGVVTKIWMDAYPLEGGVMAAGGGSTSDSKSFGALLDAFVDLATRGAELDGKANQILTFQSIVDDTGKDLKTTGYAGLVYAEGLTEGVLPGVFEPYRRVLHPRNEPPPGTSAPQRLLLNTTLRYMVAQGPIGQPAGRRNTYWTKTFTLSRESMQIALDVFLETTRAIQMSGSVKELTVALMLQPITTPILQSMMKRGGNSLGLDNGPPRLTATSVMSWVDATDDDMVMRVNEQLVGTWEKQGIQQGLEDRFVYMNYAARKQRVVEGYGAKSRENLVRVAHEYDPGSVFQKLVTGYQKLGME